MKTIAQSKQTPKVGLDVIDNQHKVLFDLAKNLTTAIGVGANIRVLDTLLNVLLNYSFQHFRTEEEYFKKHADQELHSLEHYAHIKRLNAFIIDIRNNKSNSVPPTFFENWLHDHIERFDRPCFIHESVVQEKPVGSVPASFKEKRKHKRAPYSAVVDGDIVTQCYNATHLNSGVARILDMSPGGLRLHSTTAHKIEDMLLISCKIGRNFRMKEKVKVVTAHDHCYGVEFVSPTRETTVFLTELRGAIHLNRVKQAPGRQARDDLRFAIP